MEEQVPVGEYEAKRLRRMAENKRKLVSLNFATFDRPATRARPQKFVATDPPRRSKRVKTLRSQQQTTDGLAQEAQEFMKQRTLLIRELRRKSGGFRLEGPANSSAQIASFKRQRAQELERLIAEHPPTLGLPFVYPCQLQSGPRGSTERTKDLNVQLEPFHGLCLGRQVLPEGRESVMHALCPGYGVDFGKTNRVCLMKNAIVLFDSDEDYEFMFHEGQVDGRRVVYFEWLARVRKDIRPSLVERLRKVQKGDESLRFNKSYYDTDDKAEGTKEPLLMFLEDPAGSHIYCGRLGYLGHRDSDPPEFRWQLLDVASMDWDKIFNALELEY